LTSAAQRVSLFLRRILEQNRCVIVEVVMAGKKTWLGIVLVVGSFLVATPALCQDVDRRDKYSAVPTLLRSALGCNLRIHGNGIGYDREKATMMLDGYSSTLPARGSGGSVFWCAQADNKFLLAFVQDGKLWHSECSPVLVSHNVPKGLSFSRESMDLEDFVYLDDLNRDSLNFGGAQEYPPARHGPSGEKTTGMTVRDGDDTLSEDFYCYRGAWLVRSLH
jgi:hypothetical protein